jgi:hypothetical protein
MLNLLGSLVKATVAVALTPVAVVVDTALLIPDSEDRTKPHPYSRTTGLLNAAGEAIEEGLYPK